MQHDLQRLLSLNQALQIRQHWYRFHQSGSERWCYLSRELQCCQQPDSSYRPDRCIRLRLQHRCQLRRIVVL